ncbi:TPA: KAP family P-loop NTPase fold protein [Providencia alcalifaciens]
MKILPMQPNFEDGFTSENDIFGRKKLYEQIINIIKYSLDQNLVLALNDKWGNGKTAFVKMLQGELQHSNEDINVIYFDAFQNDYQTDPLLSMISYVYELADKEDRKLSDKILYTGKAVAMNLSKQLPKKALSIITANIISEKNIENLVQTAVDSVSDPWEKYIEEKIKNSKQKENIINKFRDILVEIYKTTGKKTLFIIDEMDRAKPDFSLDLLEKIKHIFNVEGFHFLLVMNRSQFEESIKVRYGNIDSSLYLNKFIDYWFSLPKVNFSRNDYDKEKFNLLISNTTVANYIQHIDVKNSIVPNATLFKSLIYLFSLNDCSLREVEKCYSLIMILKNSNKIGMLSNIYQVMLALSGFLKICKPDLINDFLNKRIAPKDALISLSMPIEHPKNDNILIYLYIAIYYELSTGEEFNEMRKLGYFQDIEGGFPVRASLLKQNLDFFENMIIE